MHSFGQSWVVFGIFAPQNKLGKTERVWRGSDAKWHIPSTCLDASKKGFATGIYSIYRGLDSLWSENQATTQNGQNVHSYLVRTAICHIIPVSRAYPYDTFHPPPRFGDSLSFPLEDFRGHFRGRFRGTFRGSFCGSPLNREQKRHIKLWHTKLCPVTLVTGSPGRVSGQKDLCSLGSEDST